MERLCNKQEIIDEIMDFFDFERVHKVMEALNWTWTATNGNVPEVCQLRRQVRSMLNLLIDKNLESLETGGFSVTKDSNGYIKCSFIVDSWEAKNSINDEVA